MSHLFENYARWDLEIISGKGTIVKDLAGKEFLDFTSGIGVCNLGHCHPKLVKDVSAQLEKLWHISNLFQSSPQEEVAQMLTAHSDGKAVFFCNSGAEANEAAIKLARKYTGKTKVITFHKSFHGRTFGTMAATGQDKIKVGFGKMLETFIHIPYNDIDALEAVIDNNTAAVMLEVIQGEGGVNLASSEFLQHVQNLCEKYGALMVIDEVQTGIGRSGKPFAYQHFNLSPDIITSAKGLGNGFPVGAMIGKEKLKPAFYHGSHGSTFGGNPLAMAAAKTTLEIIFEHEFLLNVADKGNYLGNTLQEKLNKFESVKDIRYKGLMVGIEFSHDVSSIIAILRDNGLLVINAGPNVMRLLPPLTVTKEEIDKAVLLIENALN